jgi:predicted acylesterase/phospholipase RssA
MRIPGVAPPLATQGRLLVDGGVLNNLPIDVMAEDGDGPLIAVDVMRPFGPGASPDVPSIVDTIGRSMVLGSWQKTAATRDRAGLVITPDLGTVGMFEFARMNELVEAGRRAGLAAADQAAALQGRRHANKG